MFVFNPAGDPEPDRMSVIGKSDEVLERSRTLSERLFACASVGDLAGEWPAVSHRALVDSGFPTAVFPMALGGDGLLEQSRTADLARVLRDVGAGDLAVGRIFEGHVNAVALVLRYGTPQQADALAHEVRRGALSAVWNAEGRRPLSAQESAGRWHLDGEKILASGAGLITHPIVTPKCADGVVMLIPELAPGTRADLSAWTPQGMRATQTGTMDLSGLVVSTSAQIGNPGDYLRQPVFSGGAWRFCAVHLGAAERLVDLFRAQLSARGRAGDPYQKQRVAASVAATTTAAFWIDRAAALVAEGGDPETVVAFVNLTRMVTERACLDVLEAVHRGLGLGAFMRPDPVERISRDLATYLRQPVPDAAMADAAATVLASSKATADLWEHQGA